MEATGKGSARSFILARLRVHEVGFLALGAGALVALIARRGARSGLAAEVGAVLLLYLCGLLTAVRKDGLAGERIRLAVNYLFTFWFSWGDQPRHSCLGSPHLMETARLR